MEHYEVVEMLTAVKAPQLEARLNLRALAKTPDGIGTASFAIDVVLENTGEVMAHWVRVVFQVDHHIKAKRWSVSKGGTQSSVLYPGDVSVGAFGRFNGQPQDYGSFEHNLTGTLELAAEGMPTKRFRFRLENELQISDATVSGRDGDLILSPSDAAVD